MEIINLEYYKVFYYVAKEKNITKASEKLLISQPAITQTIKKIEDELHYKLFYRTSRGMKLTNYGEELFNYLKSSIEILNNCGGYLKKLNDESTNEIIIGGGNTLLKYNAIEGFKEFKSKYPNIEVKFVKDITANLLDQLSNNKIDLVLFNAPVIMSENIASVEVEDVQDVFVASSKDFPELKNKMLNIGNLEDLPFVLQSEVSSSRKYLNSICKKNNINLKNKYELQSYELVLDFVKAGLGVGFVNKKHIMNEIKNGELFEIKINYNIPPRKIGIAYNKKNINNKYINYFINCVVNK